MTEFINADALASTPADMSYHPFDVLPNIRQVHGVFYKITMPPVVQPMTYADFIMHYAPALTGPWRLVPRKDKQVVYLLMQARGIMRFYFPRYYQK